MDQMKIYRVASREDGTFGAAVWNGVPVFLTLEDPWNNNREGESCIPAGHYKVKRCRTSPDYNFKDSPHFGDTFQIMNVPGRSFILFHVGNRTRDTRGCVLVGEKFDPLYGDNAVLSSGEAFGEFKELTDGIDEFDLHIVNAYDDMEIGNA